MMNTVMLETCRQKKLINKYMKKCVKLVISKNLNNLVFLFNRFVANISLLNERPSHFFIVAKYW